MICQKCDTDARYVEYATFNYYYCDTCKDEVKARLDDSIKSDEKYYYQPQVELTVEEQKTLADVFGDTFPDTMRWVDDSGLVYFAVVKPYIFNTNGPQYCHWTVDQAMAVFTTYESAVKNTTSDWDIYACELKDLK